MTFPEVPEGSERRNPFFVGRSTWLKIGVLSLSLVVGLLPFGSPADAAQVPAGCSNNGVSIDIQKSATSINNGDTVTYTVTAANGNTPSCNTINNVIKGFCPDASGNPSAVPIVTFPTIPTLAVPTATFTVGTFQCTINVAPGIISPTAQATLSGSLQDNPQQDDPFSILKTVSVIVAQQPNPPPPPPNQVPTMSGWAMILFVGFMIALGAFMLRRKPAA